MERVSVCLSYPKLFSSLIIYKIQIHMSEFYNTKDPYWFFAYLQCHLRSFTKLGDFVKPMLLLRELAWSGERRVKIEAHTLMALGKLK